MLWIIVDVALVLVALVLLVLLSLGLWRRITGLRERLGALSGLAAQASDTAAQVQRR